MTDKNNNPDPDALQVAPQSEVAPALDEDKYRPYLARLSLTREQESALLRTLWSMMGTFVDLGFGLDSVQSVLGTATESALSEESNSVQPYQGPEVRETFRHVTAETHKKEVPQ